MFRTRLISGVVLVLIAIGLLTLGGYVLAGGLLLISLIGMYELYRTVGIEKSLLGAVGYAMAALYYLILILSENPAVDSMPVIFFVVFLILLMAVYVFTFPRYQAGQVMTAFFGLVYVAVMLSYMYRTRVMEGGQLLVWLVILSSWGCDTCAYCVGMLIGKHKMAPRLSPKKSVEGAVGGILGAGILGAVYGAVFGSSVGAELTSPVLDCAIICMVGAVISQIGDLAASAIKRNHDVKDYGKLIPGHGGILDRFDSVIFVAPAIYYTIVLLTRGMEAFKWFL
ncbi:phosphatidate cytidylyltransferase [Qiania dongpingensis]|uniref:Phosphatidate cytidylyltransferase n=1 Tax=Qiania dongpingensis TaxID=2763669 RepID=A0A7G9G390_9FIRM|nr:phosphatidate cytidylyltransferase [Qiania dongpingensis]QNM05272.1 phosphatidate cytidylyltransferase [Qiania dongpingensis]